MRSKSVWMDLQKERSSKARNVQRFASEGPFCRAHGWMSFTLRVVCGGGFWLGCGRKSWIGLRVRAGCWRFVSDVAGMP